MSFGKRARAPQSPARLAPTVPVIDVRDWTGESPNARIIRTTPVEPAPASRSAIGPALAGAILGLAVVVVYAFGSLPARPATYALVMDRGGNAYVIDSGLTGPECYTGLSADMFCEVESN